MKLDFADTVLAAKEQVVYSRPIRDLVRVIGPDAKSFLQGQLAQDLARSTPLTTIESLVLSPQGKLDAYVRVVSIDDETFCVDVDGGYGEALVERLRRFKLRVKVDLALESLPYVALRGPKSLEHAGALLSPEVIAFSYNWPGLSGADLAGVDVDELGDLDEGDVDALEMLRIQAGQPVMGAELTDKTIPQETTLSGRAVSFTKGCFTGQELVARIDARGGNVPRHLRALVVEPGDRHRMAYVGEPVLVEGKEVGAITSVAFSRTDDRSYALAYIHRSIDVPAEGVVIAAGGEDELAVAINALPSLD